ncbi:hypothetical protein [uncultured Cohaesibacter sp.]|uniref:hypothetical protein n=1 Tax=uncultured Cohaesibacter sp. TaxID=1002546 RepID=UPI0029C89BCF|nr:hypothetical protein [uncultured Cohaesibacter sp.]
MSSVRSITPIRGGYALLIGSIFDKNISDAKSFDLDLKLNCRDAPKLNSACLCGLLTLALHEIQNAHKKTPRAGVHTFLCQLIEEAYHIFVIFPMFDSDQTVTWPSYRILQFHYIRKNSRIQPFPGMEMAIYSSKIQV